MTIRTPDRAYDKTRAGNPEQPVNKPRKLKKGATAAPDPKEQAKSGATTEYTNRNDRGPDAQPAAGARAARDEANISAGVKKKLKKDPKGSFVGEVGWLGKAYGKRPHNYAHKISTDPLSPH